MVLRNTGRQVLVLPKRSEKELFALCQRLTDIVRTQLDAWFSAEGSVNAAAASLYIHKNTLQYRLKRLAEISGLDVRLPSQAPALYLALLFFRELDASQDN